MAEARRQEVRWREREGLGARAASCSVRHYHIGQSLNYDAGVILLAENTGTRPDMTGPFYGQRKFERMPKELRAEWRAGPDGRGA